MTHQSQFQAFVEDLNDSHVRYVFMRGWDTLPEKPNTDIDLVCHYEDFERYTSIAQKHLKGFHFENRGFAEYCDMLYHPYRTTAPHDNNIPNGFFRIDSYNSFFFKSPLNNFKGCWTVPHKFNEYIFDWNSLVDVGPYRFKTPDPESEVVLLVLRNVLDQQGNWKRKHLDMMEHTLFSSIDQKRLTEVLEIAVLARPDELCKSILDLDTDEINNIVMKG